MGSAQESIPQLLKRLGIRPKKSLGQNFLVSTSICQAIVQVAAVSSHDVVVEVGPGLGTLTAALAERGATVIAVEIDHRLILYLKEKFVSCPNVHLVHSDILEIPPLELLKVAGAAPPYKLVANIPYYITSAVLRHFLEEPPRPSLLVLMMQKEVAHRLSAKPPDMSLLALSVQLFGTPEIIMEIGRGAFYPPPKVMSAVVRVVVPPVPPYPACDYPFLFRIARICFQQARKQVAGTLGRALGLDRKQIEDILLELGLNKRARPQEIAVEKWVALADHVRLLLSEHGHTRK